MTERVSRPRHLYLLALGLACGAASPTPELLTARNVYAQARNGEAAQLNPRGVYEAYKALEGAERAHATDPGSQAERSRAYVATRTAELAIARAGEALAARERARAEESLRAQAHAPARQRASAATQLMRGVEGELAAGAASRKRRELELEEARRVTDRARAELERQPGPQRAALAKGASR